MIKEEKVNPVDVLKVVGLAKQFGGLEILKGLSFSVKEGERRAFIGPNGAGKTTLFNIIAGDLPASSGEVYYYNENFSRKANHQRVRSGMVRTFQKNNLLQNMSVLEHLLLVLQMKAGVENVWYRNRTAFSELYERAEYMMETWGLADRKNTIVKNLSYGEQRQVEIVLGIATEPRVLLLDEPTAGMSNAETQHILQLLKSMPRDLTLLIIEHDMDVVFGLADRITVLYNGDILVEGSTSTIQSDPRVHEIYFGKEDF